MMVSESKIRVRYGETDQMGVAHHVPYLQWLEVARTDWLRLLGMRYRDLEKRDVVLTVTDVNIRYRRPARYDDLLRVRCWVRMQKRLKLDFSYEILAEDDTLIAEANTVLGCLNQQGRPQPMPQDVADAIAAAMNGHERVIKEA
jgi:acyl-CoA thioester hydrolase